MRTLLVGEGIHEIGDDARVGALEVLVRRLGPLQIDEVRPWKDPVVRSHRGQGGGVFKRAYRWIQWASEQGFDAVVVVIDEDGDRERARDFARAQDEADLTLPRALGVAVRTFDAWMLADHVALSHVLHRTVDTQPDPEDVSEPKDRMLAIIAGSPGEDAARRVYAAIAERADIQALERRCPRGFCTFASRVRRLAAPVS